MREGVFFECTTLPGSVLGKDCAVIAGSSGTDEFVVAEGGPITLTQRSCQDLTADRSAKPSRALGLRSNQPRPA